QLFLPNVICLKGQQNIGFVLFHQIDELAIFFIRSQNIAYQDRNGSIIIFARISHHLFLGEKSIGINLRQLIKHTDKKQSLHDPLPHLPLPEAYEKQTHCRKGNKSDLQSGKIKYPNPPFVTPKQGSDECKNSNRCQQGG